MGGKVKKHGGEQGRCWGQAVGHKDISQGRGRRFLLRKWPRTCVLKGEPEPPRSGERPKQEEGHVQRTGRQGKGTPGGWRGLMGGRSQVRSAEQLSLASQGGQEKPQGLLQRQGTP